jgi:hypothetical protein
VRDGYACKDLNLNDKKIWSGSEDLNLRPPGPTRFQTLVKSIEIWWFQVIAVALDAGALLKFSETW